MFMSYVYINKSALMKIELKIESWGKQNRDLNLEAILSKVAISTLMLEIEPALLFCHKFTNQHCDSAAAHTVLQCCVF